MWRGGREEPKEETRMSTSNPRQPTLAGLAPVGSDEPVGALGGDPKLQLSNGYLLRFDQVSRILGAIAGREHQARVTGEDLMEDTGLSSVHIKNLCSMAVGHRADQAYFLQPAPAGRADRSARPLLRRSRHAVGLSLSPGVQSSQSGLAAVGQPDTA